MIFYSKIFFARNLVERYAKSVHVFLYVIFLLKKQFYMRCILKDKENVLVDVKEEVKEKYLKVVREVATNVDSKTTDKVFYNYSVKGQVRNRDVVAYMSPKDKGGYALLDIVFGDSNEADLIVTPCETVQENGDIIKWTSYMVRNIVDGEVYECDIKPLRGSDKTVISMLLNQLK